MKRNRVTQPPSGGKEQRDAAIECVSAGLNIGAALATIELPPVAIGIGYMAATSSAACVAKVVALIAGQSAREYEQISNGLSLMEPFGLAAAMVTSGDTLKDSTVVTSYSILNSETKLLYEILAGAEKNKIVLGLTIATDTAKLFNMEVVGVDLERNKSTEVIYGTDDRESDEYSQQSELDSDY